MKNLLLIIAATVIVTATVKQAEACAPPRDRYGFQQPETRSLFSDNEVEKTILELANKVATVKSVVVENGYVISLTNDCQFTAVPVWERPQAAGMCPTLKGFKIENKLCPQRQ